MQKVLVVNLSVMLMLTLSSTQENMKWNLATDGTVEWYAANVIANNMYAQVDDEGVGKEMPISRIVVAVPNATVVLLD
jgi:hypothetical protein